MKGQSIKFVIKINNTILGSMQCNEAFFQNLLTDFQPSGWEDGALLPKNLNVERSMQSKGKNVRAINRKQFLQRRRKHQKIDMIGQEMLQLRAKGNMQLFPEMAIQKTKSDNFSSITQLKHHMHNLQKIRNRWNEEQEHCFNQKCNKEVRSSRTGHNIPSEQPNFQRTQTIRMEVYSSRTNRARPASSIKDSSKRSMTLSERSNTIHSRCSKRSLSSKPKPSRPKNKSQTRLNITINQLQPSKMNSILKILMNH